MKQKKIVNICGMIGAGKTYTIKNIQKEFNKNEYLKSDECKSLMKKIEDFKFYFEIPDKNILYNYYYYFKYNIWFKIGLILTLFLIKIIGIDIGILLLLIIFFYMPKNLCFETQIYFLNLRIKSFLEKRKFKGLIFIDRSLEEDKIFANLQITNNFFTKNQERIYLSFFEEYSKITNESSALYIYLKVSANRAKLNSDLRGDNISLYYLKNLEQEYKKWEVEMKKKHAENFIVINNENNNLDLNKIYLMINCYVSRN